MFKNLNTKILASIFLLLVIIIIATAFTVSPINKIAQALSSNYNKTLGAPSTATTLSASDWNNLPNDFVARTGGAGSAMQGNLDMGNNRITNLAAPTANNDAVTKQYVDNGGTKDNSGNQIKIVCGQAPPTWTDAIGYTNSAAITIDTTIGGVPAFSTTPIYFTSISCNSACWRSTGYNAVYNSSPSSFQIFVQNVGDPIYLNGASAIANNWIIRWCGMGR